MCIFWAGSSAVITFSKGTVPKEAKKLIVSQADYCCSSLAPLVPARLGSSPLPSTVLVPGPGLLPEPPVSASLLSRPPHSQNSPQQPLPPEPPLSHHRLAPLFESVCLLCLEGHTYLPPPQTCYSLVPALSSPDTALKCHG